MEKEKVIRALENCIGSQPCKNCPYEKGYLAFPSCAVDMFKDALAIIKGNNLEIVRCCECEHYKPSYIGSTGKIDNYGYCERLDFLSSEQKFRTEEEFCSFAKRKN